MKKLLICILMCAVFGVCNAEDYDSLKSKYDALVIEHENLHSEYVSFLAEGVILGNYAEALEYEFEYMADVVDTLATSLFMCYMDMEDPSLVEQSELEQTIIDALEYWYEMDEYFYGTEDSSGALPLDEDQGTKFLNKVLQKVDELK